MVFAESETMTLNVVLYCTGFDDALVSLDKLMTTNFQLPIDLAVRPFHNIKDAF